jgi:hypothetical protein
LKRGRFAPAGNMKRFQLLHEFWLFLRQNKKLWLVPMILTLVLIGGLLIFAQSSALAPFIYSIF